MRAGLAPLSHLHCFALVTASRVLRTMLHGSPLKPLPFAPCAPLAFTRTNTATASPSLRVQVFFLRRSGIFGRTPRQIVTAVGWGRGEMPPPRVIP